MSAERSHKVTQLQSQYMQQQERNDQILKRRKRGLFRRLTVFGAIVALFAIFIITGMINQSAALSEQAEQKDKLTGELNDLKKEQSMLEEEIGKLNDDDYIAELARRDYFLSGENEIIFSSPDKK
ncbi:septum formation initiator family protein [Metabacillus sp. KIGAM252]|uniref:Septum formation initiator family protein n=1 Tax=Metabacillus flavus TaxID=2823519 RepID=A0ABS5L9R4_9BACI|nr:septum formation initiator family protein [Metabacillus flavus]MBS2967278.1 septum formation initiator family protein [Metabacillus flavus]